MTIYDVANAAGVSAATVSYVINEKEDQSISDETKQKVWHTINLLKYKPNVFAKNLRAAPQSKLIAICTDDLGELARAEYLYTLECFSECFPQDYSLVFVTDSRKKIANTDAIIAYNVSKHTFYEIGNRNFVPLIAVDCIVNDAVFFQITTDYLKLKNEAVKYFGSDYTYVVINPSDCSIKDEICKNFKSTIFVESYADLNNIKNDKILTSSFTISQYLQKQNIITLYSKEILSTKCLQTINCIAQALSDEHFDKHTFKV